MRRLVLVPVLLLAGGSAAAQSTDTKADRELTALEEQWGTALSRNDTAFFQRVMADDFLQTGGPHIGTKRDFLASLTGVPDSARSELSETVIRHYGPVAVVTGLVTWPAQGRRSRYTEVWTHEGGRWQVHHGHYNDLPREVAPSDTGAGPGVGTGHS